MWCVCTTPSARVIFRGRAGRLPLDIRRNQAIQSLALNALNYPVGNCLVLNFHVPRSLAGEVVGKHR